jgi:hypothetical protein
MQRDAQVRVGLVRERGPGQLVRTLVAAAAQVGPDTGGAEPALDPCGQVVRDVGLAQPVTLPAVVEAAVPGVDHHGLAG